MDNIVDISPSVATKPIVLNSRQSKFLASYQLTGNATESAINAGYSAKSAAIEGYRLLKHPKILAELNTWKVKKATAISKDDFIDLALTDYKALELTEANKPRFLDIAGKALGYTANNATPQSTTITNNIQVNMLEIMSKPINDRLEFLRGILSPPQGT